MITEIVAIIDATGTLLIGLGAVGIIRRQKRTAAKVDDLHSAKFPDGQP